MVVILNGDCGQYKGALYVSWWLWYVLSCLKTKMYDFSSKTMSK